MSLNELGPSTLPIGYAGAHRTPEGVRNVRVNYPIGKRDAVKRLIDFGHGRIGYEVNIRIPYD